MKIKIAKSLILILACILLCFSVASCGDGESDDSPGINNGENNDNGNTDNSENGDNAGGGETHTHLLTHIDGKEANCIEEGNIEYWYCSGCDTCFKDANAKETVSISKTIIGKNEAHSYGEWETVKSSTCTEKGSKYKTCLFCQYKIMEDIPIENHKYLNEYLCADCGYSIEATEGLEYSLAGDNTCYSVSGIGTATNESTIVIPFTYNGLPVENILDNAFENCKNIEEIIIPNSVWRICYDAFESCTNLKKVQLPSSLTVIEASAFYNCVALNDINLHDGITEIGSSTFMYCRDLEKIYIPGSISSLPDSMFSGCSALKEIVFPKSLKSIGDYAFRGTNLREFYIPDGVEEIGLGAFAECEHLTKVTIPASVSALGLSMFRDCHHLEKVYYNAISAKDLENKSGCFDNAGLYSQNGLSLIIGSNVKRIPAFMFSKWSDQSYNHNKIELSEIIFEENSQCVEFGKNAFIDCKSLNAVYYNDDINKWTQITFDTYFSNPICDANHFYVNNTEALSVDLSAATQINDYVFYGLEQMTCVEFGNNLVSIGISSFDGCTGLTELKLPDSLNNLGEKAFSSCSNLKTINIPLNTKSIGNSAFSGCSAFESVDFDAQNMADREDKTFGVFGISDVGMRVNIGASVKHIPSYLFSTGKISEVVFASDTLCESIGAGAFACCDKETVVKWSKSLDEWAMIEFSGETSNPLSWSGEFYIDDEKLTKIDLTYATKINAYAFYGFTDVVSVSIPSSVEEIGLKAFYGCYSLSEIDFNAKNLLDLQGSSDIFGNAGKNSDGIAVTIKSDVQRIPNYLFGCLDKVNKNIKTVEFESTSSCTNIGVYAFGACESLADISFPDSLETIEASAFSGCVLLNEITIPKNIKNINYRAFAGCTAVTQIYFNAENMDLNSIGKEIFYNAGRNSDGTTVIVGRDVKCIPALLFAASDSSVCPNIISVIFSDDSECSIIGSQAFAECCELKEIVLPGNLSRVDSDAFAGCINLSYNVYDNCEYLGSKNSDFEVLIRSKDVSRESVQIHDNAKIICNDAFSGCENIGILDIPAEVRFIGDNAFSGCTSLKNLIIPDSVETLGKASFYNCSGLETLSLGKGIIHIGADAFYRCAVNLKTIVMPVENAQYSAKGACLVEKSSNTLLLGCAASIIPLDGSVNKITDYAFWGCLGVEEISIPNGVQSISEAMFYNCCNLKTIILPASVNSIGAHAFRGCSNLKSVEIPDGVKAILGYTFYQCAALEKVQIPNTVANIGDSAFEGCIALTDAQLSNAVLSIGKRAFYDCKKLSNFIMPNSLKAIEPYTFYNCSSLTDIQLPNTLESLGLYSFYQCTGITSIEIPELVKTIEAYTFYNCDNLITVKLNSGLKKIETRAFYSCGIQKIVIPDTTDFIEQFAFAGNNLTYAAVGYGWTRTYWTGNGDQIRYVSDFIGTKDFSEMAHMLSCSGGYNADRYNPSIGQMYGDWRR